jgi:hypothetical protein
VLGQPSSLNSTNCAVKQTLAVIGHSFGGLPTQILAGRGLSAVSVAIDPAPFRGVLPLPISALKSGSPVLHNPANRNRAVPRQLPLRNDVREMLSQVQHLPKDAEVLAFEPGCEEYCEREIDDVE